MVTLLETDTPQEDAEQFMLQKIDAFKVPQLKIAIFRKNDRDTLCVLINHMLCDAAGFKDFLAHLSSTYTHLCADPHFRPTSIMGRRDMGQLMETYSRVERRRMMSYKADKKAQDYGTNFTFEGDLENPFIAIKTISKELFVPIKAYAKAHHATINDVVVTAYIRAFYACSGTVLSLPCTMDLRKLLPERKSSSITNLVTNVTCDIGLELGHTFEETLLKVKQSMDKAKINPAFVGPVAMLNFAHRHLPHQIAKNLIGKTFSNPVIAFTNIGILDPAHLTFGDTPMLSAFMTGSIKYIPYFQLALSTFREEMTFSVNLRGTQKDYDKIERFLTAFDQELISAEQSES